MCMDSRITATGFPHWAIKLAREGFGVIAVDLRGHGRSEGRRGYADSFDRYLQDVRVLCDFSRNHYPGIRQFLYGHSLGGNIVTNYLISGRQLPHAAIITSPWFKLAFEPSLCHTHAGHFPGIYDAGNSCQV